MVAAEETEYKTDLGCISLQTFVPKWCLQCRYGALKALRKLFIEEVRKKPVLYSSLHHSR